MKSLPSQSAFSLVELSIVLVILGLLVGGVLSGQSLIHAAELRSVGEEYQRYVGAVAQFRDKYFALPGDMPNGQSFWGSAAACPGTSPTSVTGVCNGDGNGQIESNPNSAYDERLGAWQELAQAGLIEGSYTGQTTDPSTSPSVLAVGTNVPVSKLRNGVWNFLWFPNQLNMYINNVDRSWGNLLSYGTMSANSMYSVEALLTPKDAWNIDTKVDDGKPASGRVVAEVFGDPYTCKSDPMSPSADYSLSKPDVACSFLFKTGF